MQGVEAAGSADATEDVRWARTEGVSLLGAVRDSGLQSTPHLVRRADGQVIQVSQLLGLVLARIDPRRPVEDIARAVSVAYGRTLPPDGLDYLLRTKLQPLGVVAPLGPHPAPAVTAAPRATPVLSLGLRGTLIPQSVVRPLARALSPLFHPVVVVAALVALVVMDVRLLLSGDVMSALTDVLATPTLLLVLFALSTLGAIAHELGHATACSYSGADPGRIGFGVYLLFPAFFTNVTDSYRLGRAGRLRTDLGGLYFNVLCLLAFGAVHAATGSGLLLLLIVLTHVEMVEQLLPTVRFDGYFVLTDLTGIPDLFSRIRPVLRTLVPDGRPPDPRVAEMSATARRVVVAWVLVVVPLIAVGTVWTLVHLPEIVRTTLESMVTQVELWRTAWAQGDYAAVALTSISAFLLLIPLAGLALFLYRIVLLVARAARRRLGLVSRQGLMSTTDPAPTSTPVMPVNGQAPPAPGPVAAPPPPAAAPGSGATAERVPPGASVGATDSGRASQLPVDGGKADQADRSGPPDGAPEATPEGASRRADWSTWFSADELTDDTFFGPERPVARSGWRRAVGAATGGKIALGPGAAEQRRDAIAARVRAPIDGSRRIVVMSRKGGVGKTTVTVALGATFAMRRGDRVVAVDANPDAGNLARRIAGDCPRTITDLLADVEAVDTFSAMRRYTSQCDESRLEVLASDDDARISQGLDRPGYRRVVSLLDHYYNLILLDTGTGILDSANQGLIAEADQLVLVLRPALDGARAGAQTLDWLDQHGYADLVSSAVVVINAVTRPEDHTVRIVTDHFAQRCAHVAQVPWDPALETGGRTTLSRMAPRTQEAFVDVAAAVADRFSTMGGR
ncbi:membrane protein [Intrasporangium oryzae NRRL B-24470]|uniref:Membrane protein n=1 Tax=Intrasporangium oryzae NRRL B-24470 TaxID=1386089 RepID=W9G737_9MICO|nr:membrane protein [Intrasporangium oryzae NRRL B-24470]